MAADLPDIKNFLDGIKEALKLVLGEDIPAWVLKCVGYIILLALLLGALCFLLWVVAKCAKLWRESLWPLFYDAKKKRRAIRRRRFADHIESEIRRLNNLEEWRDYSFAELEAEVEAEGKARRSWLPFGRTVRSTLRREKSLSKALETSAERHILLVGEPGCGKSVALRHVALVLARKAMGSRQAKSLVPLYINLKELDRESGERIDAGLIRRYVLKCLNRVNDLDVERFLDAEFDQGLREGTWLFLFDSFDEIPEILSSTEYDNTIRAYGAAIADFLHGMNQCRGILASRHFRGPGQLGWSRFRVLPLTEKRRVDLVRKADLGREKERLLIGRISIFGGEGFLIHSNPMFLGILCEQVRSGAPLPASPHEVFDAYVVNRLSRDAERIERRFAINPAALRATAEDVAFCMVAEPKLGLSPARDTLKACMVAQGVGLPAQIDLCMDALEYIKFARSATASGDSSTRRFTFAHRRFQEYFATCVVLRRPDRVGPRNLLLDGRWRETAVALCQTQPREALRPFLEAAEEFLFQSAASVPGLIENPEEYVRSAEAGSKEEKDKQPIRRELFPWPPKLLHVLALLQEGFSSSIRDLPEKLRNMVARFILSAYETGLLPDRRCAVEVAGAIPEPVLLYVLRRAFGTGIQWLSDPAYSQVARLGKIPEDLARRILDATTRLALDGRLHHEVLATEAHLSRLDGASRFLSGLRLLLWVPRIDTVAHGAAILLATYTLASGGAYSSLALNYGALFYCLVSYTTLWHAHLYAGLGFSSGGTRLTGVCLRLCSGAILVHLCARISAPCLVPAAVVMYVLLWTLGALFAVRSGMPTGPAWWLVFPIWLLLKVLIGISHGLTSATLWLGQQAIKSLIALVVLGGCVWLADVLGVIPHLVIGVGVLLASAFAFVAVSFTWDGFRARRWSAPGPVMPLSEFVHKLHALSYPTNLVLFLRRVRAHSLLSADTENIAMLNALIIDIESGPSDDPVAGAAPSTRQESAESNHNQAEFSVQTAGERRRRLRHRGPDVLEEICRLREDLLRRQEMLSPP